MSIPIYSLAISDDTATAAALTRLAGAHFGAAQTVLRGLGTAYEAQLRVDTPLGTGEAPKCAPARRVEAPGRLRAGYRRSSFYSATIAEERITNTTPHLRYVLRGRGPIIAPRGRALRFVIRGVVFFRTRVGPAAANDYPARTRRAMQRQVDQAGQSLADAMIRVYEGA